MVTSQYIRDNHPAWEVSPSTRQGMHPWTKYSPIDVIVGRDMALAGVQLDLEPFYVVLATFSEDYQKKSGLS